MGEQSYSVTSFSKQLFEALYSNPDIEDGINQTIAMIGDKFNVSRVYVFENCEDNRFSNNTFEWCADGIEPQMQYLQNMSYEEYGYYELFGTSGVFCCHDVSTLPEKQCELFESQGIKATLQFAIYDKDIFRGFIGFDDCKQTRQDLKPEKEEFSTLIFLSKLLSVYLIKERNLQISMEYHKRMEIALEKAKEANTAKSNFLSKMSHDIRTPLNAILGLTNLSFDDLEHPEIMRENLIKIKESGDFLLGLINDVLDMSKIEAGAVELHTAPMSYADFMSGIQSMFFPLCLQKNQIFEIDTEPDYTIVLTDAVRLQQIFFNLLSNAVKYTPAGGKISMHRTIRNIADNKMVCDFLISDSGIGMSEEYQKHLFQPFSRENGEVTSHAEGTGLGLTIAKNLVELMGGYIQVNSKKGIGTTIHLHIPFVIAPAGTVINAGGNEYLDEDYILYGKRVLLAEDHSLNAEIATKLLKKEKIEVVHASNGAIALEMYKNSAPNYYDAILMDIRMPEMDGLTATKRIRNLPREDAASIPILALTANAFEDENVEMLEAGMNEHLAKPIEPHRLYSALIRQFKITDHVMRPVVLIVDDVEMNAAVIAEVLKTKYATVTLSDAKEALEMLKNNQRIVAVITDIQMPEMNGNELIKRIRANSAYNHIAILANTQYGDANQEGDLLSIGADDFIYKPTTPLVVQTRLMNVIARKHMH